MKYNNNTHYSRDNKRPIDKWWNLNIFDKRRNVFVNIIFLLIQILGLLSFYDLGRAGMHYVSYPDYPFIEIYHKGYIPGSLIAISAVICNSMILKWNRAGFFLLPILFFGAALPYAFTYFEGFIHFSVFPILGIVAYFLILQIPHNGISTWKLCNMRSNSIVYISMFTILIQGTLLTVFPISMAQGAGFQRNLYNNGQIVIEAHFYRDPFYLWRLANRIAFSGENERESNAGDWYIMAINKSNVELYDWFSRIRAIENYVDYIYYLVKENRDEVYRNYIIAKAIEKFGYADIKEEIEAKSDEYDRMPYRENVLRCIDAVAN